MIRTKLIGLVVFVLLFVMVAYGGRYITYRQTDPDDIITRDKIDRQIDALFERFDREIQVDTTLLVAGTSQIIYLERKYKDVNYQIFLIPRAQRGTLNAHYSVVPTTDSSFTITKHNDDLSTLMYMTIRK